MNRIFSGIQPTGNLHLGNYLGAIRNWVALQHDYECIFCIVDLHALTLPQDPDRIARLDARGDGRLHRRRDRPGALHRSSTRAWSPPMPSLPGCSRCLTPLGWLNRMTQFKEKAGKNREMAGLGLYAYPVLMAADILVYKATHVPVGEDQKQHLELARDIAGAFNRRYERDFFPLPEPQIFGAATRVMSLRDGTKKMSKSDSSDYSRINMTDDADAIALKIRRAKTDPEPLSETTRRPRTPPGGRQSDRHLRRAVRAVARGGARPLCRPEFLVFQGGAVRARGRGAGPHRPGDGPANGRPRLYRRRAAPRGRARQRDRPTGAARGAGDQRPTAALIQRSGRRLRIQADVAKR